MRIGIVSDSHSNLSNIQRAVRCLEGLKVQTLLHCGDIANPAAVQAFAGFEIYFVFGNVDDDRESLRHSIAVIGGRCCERFGQFELAERRIAFLHGDDPRSLEREERSGRHDLLCYGHTHRAEWHHSAGTLVVNPGALHRAAVHTLALYDTVEQTVQILPI